MKQLTIISGKGGTGKTTITASLSAIADDAVIADCDVDAPDLHLILNPEVIEVEEFTGMKVAEVDKDKCIHCMECYNFCRFDAIDKDINIDPIECEGCAVCEYVCKENAIKMKEKRAGFAYISKTRFGYMAHAKLEIAEETSGKLVAVVRKNARELAERYGKKLIIIDGSPGIGCPVIAAITGVDLVLIVTEPTVSAIGDMRRVLKVVEHFAIPAVVCINKWNLNKKNTEEIEAYCRKKGIEIIAKVPYDKTAVDSMVSGRSVIEYKPYSEISKSISKLWDGIKERLKI